MKINIDKEDLEKALIKENKSKSPDVQPEMSKIEEIAFHKGALNTLVGERNELYKMVQTVEAIMQAHAKRLQELGVKIDSKQQ
jgi:hypothetical protein